MRLARYLMALVLLLAASVPAEGGVGLPEIGSVQIGPYPVHVFNDSMGLRRGRNTLTVHVPTLPSSHVVTLQLRGPQGEIVEVPLRTLHVVGGGSARESHLTVPTVGAAPHHGTSARAAEIQGHAHDTTAASDTTHGSAPAADVAHGGRAEGGHAHGAPASSPASHEHATERGAARGPSPHGGDTPLGVADHDGTVPGAPAHADGSVGAGHGSGSVTFAGYAVRGVARLPSTGAWWAVLTIGDGQDAPLAGEFRVDVAADGPGSVFVGVVGLLTGGSVLYGAIRRKRGEGRS